MEATTVSALARYLKDLLESNLTLTNLWVEGEISNLTRSQRGHVYFTLKDANAQIACVMFQRQYRGAPLENGAQVLGHGNVSFYEQRGNVQLIVDFVQPAGVGARQAEFERLKEKLAADGLFDEARKRALPAFPTRIGVVTSPTGAVFHDICNVLARRWPLAEVVLAPTPVQGVEAAIGITEAIRQLNRVRDVDVIILARGGGSIEELWPFNEEIVARAVYASTVPVISGVGHETDFTILDFVADARAPTPSAAAAAVAPDWRDISRRIDAILLAVSSAATSKVSQNAINVDRASRRLALALPDTSRYAERLASLLRHAAAGLARSLGLGALDPAATLSRGYAVVQIRDGKQAVTSVKQVKGRERLDIHVNDGRFPAEVSRQYGF
ncbi:MAG: exodeoxyribonuclease VII large subunit [Chloroflexi bacterium]|nr:MAG: exodeoxyribonuclease VII large subunit [Chloroflexota bacterium]